MEDKNFTWQLSLTLETLDYFRLLAAIEIQIKKQEKSSLAIEVFEAESLRRIYDAIEKQFNAQFFGS